MTKACVINGSPTMERGATAILLNSFTEGLKAGNVDVDLIYASRLKVKPCSCGDLDCWNKSPGVCVIKDEMQNLYPVLRQADVLVMGIPQYIPLPGDMQNIINRLCPLLDPVEKFESGRTRVRFRKEVLISKIVLVAVSGWWEKENMDTLVRIVQELAADANVEFSGALIRPQAHLLQSAGKHSDIAQKVLVAAREVGKQFALKGHLDPVLLEQVSQPFMPLEDYLRRIG